MGSALNIAVYVSIGVVFLILVGGIYTLFRGGDVSRSYSNKLMRFRVIAQLVAVVVLMTALWWFRSRAGG